MAARRSWFARKDSRSDWPGDVDLERHLAQIDDRSLRDERFDLVDSVRDLSLRRLARFSTGSGSDRIN